MAFETRGNSGLYYYSSRRDPDSGKVKKVYLGRGPQAEIAARALARRREQREKEREAVRKTAGELQAVDALMGRVSEATTALLEAVLLATGFHRQNYSAWRRKRQRS
jgi:hypothetical protein